MINYQRIQGVTSFASAVKNHARTQPYSFLPRVYSARMSYNAV
jgi:hypothetical protein